MSQVPLSQVLRVYYANRIHIPSSLSFCLQPITLNTKFVFFFSSQEQYFQILFICSI